ncbi:MAG TPA: peptide chain release factor 2 [Chthonomonadales bacterium]|nr:peptide chain release factor 2 [Chthonomonadales bacterium]
MSLEAIRSEARELRTRLDELGGHLDVAGRTAEIAELERCAARPDLWEDAPSAQEILQRLSRSKESIAPFRELGSRLDDVEVMSDLLEEAGEEDSQAEAGLSNDLRGISGDLEQLELETLLSDPHDDAEAIVEIRSGAGGTDASDWAAMLQRMYIKWAELHRRSVEILDESEAEIAGLKSTTFLVHGKNAYGYLKAEKGVHRLVRISPFDANKRRQTSFAQVDVLPDLDKEVTVEIQPDDLRIDYYRSSGAGGQHVNKTDSAVRITHLPTNIVVTCQNERSQHKNRDMAMKVLHARLLERERRENEEKVSALKGEAKPNEWGSQDRSYTIHPYTLVKDLRTGYETGDVVGVFSGQLDPFIQAYLQWNQSARIKKQPGAN